MGTDVRAGAARGGPVLRGPAVQCTTAGPRGAEVSGKPESAAACLALWAGSDPGVSGGGHPGLGLQRRAESLGAPRGCGSRPELDCPRSRGAGGVCGPRGERGAWARGDARLPQPGTAGARREPGLAEAARGHGSRQTPRWVGAAFAGARGTEAVAPEAVWGLWSRQAEPEAWLCGRLPGVWGTGAGGCHGGPGAEGACRQPPGAAEPAWCRAA